MSGRESARLVAWRFCQLVGPWLVFYVVEGALAVGACDAPSTWQSRLGAGLSEPLYVLWPGLVVGALSWLLLMGAWRLGCLTWLSCLALGVVLTAAWGFAVIPVFRD